MKNEPVNLAAKDRKAFTLIELVGGDRHHRHPGRDCCCPRSSRAKDRAKGVQCMNNTRQMMVGWKMYPDDYNEVLLAGKSDPSKPNDFVTSQRAALVLLPGMCARPTRTGTIPRFTSPSAL